MNRIKNILYRCGWIILIILVCLSGVYFLREYKESRAYIQGRARDFSTKYAQKERSLEVILDSLTAVLNSDPGDISNILWQKIPSDRYEVEGLAAFVWHNDSLVYWSHNTIPVPEVWEEGLFEAPFMRMKTIWVVPEEREIKDYKLVGMILIKWVYPYENNLLENSFHPSFGLPNSVKISTQPFPDSFQVVSKKGDPLFYLFFDESVQSKLTEVTIPSVLYWIVYILLLICPYYWLSDKSDQFRRRALIFLLFAGIALRILMQTFMWPDVWYQSKWFDPKYLAVLYLFPSLGDLLVTVLTITAFTFYFCRFYRFSSPISFRYISQRSNSHIGYIFWLLLVMFLYFLIMDTIERIVMNSNIDATNSLMFTSVSLVVYFSIALLLTSSVLLFEKWIEYVRNDFSYNTFRALILSVFFIAVLFSLILHQTDLFIVALAFPFIALIIARVKYTSVHGYRYVELVLLVFVFALYTTGLVYYYGELRSRQDRNILAMNLASERDEVAEYLLSELAPVLREDSVLHELVKKDDFSIDEINNYLTRQYFYGYWDKYSFQFILCHPDDNLLLDPPSQQETPCHSFFYNITVQKGVPLPNSDFYFIQNRNGRMTYLGSLNFEQADHSGDVSLFIELTSKYYTYEIGYPELLIERKISQNLSLSNYSYARYYQNLLIDNYGDFAYHRTDQIYGDVQPGTFKNVDFNDYHHTVYNAGGETLFVLSTPVASYWTLLITLSYVFLLFVLLASIFLLPVTVRSCMS